jgi:hypothetical protein
VALDEPHVSIRGLLDRNFGYSFLENPKYGGYSQQIRNKKR